MIGHKSFVFTFADVEVREREFCIVKAGEVVPVEPKAFRVLVFLLRNPHRLITKDELLDAVWNDCAVSENSLTRSIALLRRLLGDGTREPRYIATVPTVGYRFLCDVHAAEDGFGVLEVPNLRQLDNGDKPEPLEGPNKVSDNFHTPRDQTAAAEGVHARDPQPSEEGQRRSRRPLIAGLIAASLVVLVAGFLLYHALSNPNSHRSANMAGASSRMRVVPLTNLPGNVRDPAFSPDGEKIAFVWDGENPVKGDIYVQLVGGEKPLRLTHTRSGFTCCADWSPDGREIAFGRCDDRGGGVFTVPALGGPERKLSDVVCPWWGAGFPKWIADGRSLLLVDRCVPNGPSGIVVFSLETGDKRCLSSPNSYPGDSFPALSPDGRTVAFLGSTTVGALELYTVALSGGDPRQITHEGWAGWNLMWSSDGHHIVFDSTRGGLARVWRVAAKGGAVEPEAVYPGSGALSRDGRRLAYIDPLDLRVRALAIWRIALSSAGGQVVSQRSVHSADLGNNAPQPSTDGRLLAFESCRTGRCQIWKSDADGGNPLQLTSFDKGFPGTPRWSPDGKWVVFDNHPDMHSQIYLVDSEGRNLHSVTSGSDVNVVPSWSGDGTTLYFASNRTGNWQVWSRELLTGREKQVTHHGGFAAFESHDGKTLYYSKFDAGGLWSVPVDGGEEVEVTDALHVGYWGHFAVTDNGLYLLDSDASPKGTVMFYSFQTHSLKPVFELAEDPVPWAANLAASRDGQTIFAAQGSEHNSITLAENFQ